MPMTLPQQVLDNVLSFRIVLYGCEGDLAATSVTPLMARAGLAGEVGVPLLPHRPTRVPPEAACSSSPRGGAFSSALGTRQLSSLLEPSKKLSKSCMMWMRCPQNVTLVYVN